MASVQLDSIVKSYGRLDVIHGASVSIENGEFVVFVGPSGCGKSTLLRVIAGLEEIRSGVVRVGGRDVTHEEPSDRGVAMVFQSYALYPHMTVDDNMSFGLKLARKLKPEIRRRVAAASSTLGLDELLERRPRALSGGQRQRVAIGRAIVRDPDVFLFDEPLSNLDAELRVRMRVEIARLHKRLGATMIYVTHDQIEAMTLADRIVVLDSGRIIQVGRPLELYDDPNNLFVAGFIGSPKMNLLRGKVAERSGSQVIVTLVSRSNARITVNADPDRLKTGDEVVVGIRPEHIAIVPPREGDFEAVTEVAEQLGDVSYIHTDGEDDESLVIGRHGNRHFIKGETVGIVLPSARTYLFDANGQRVRALMAT